MRQFNPWDNVQVKDEDHEHFGRAGKVGRVQDEEGNPLYEDTQVPVLLDGETEELVFDAAELRRL